MIEMHASFQRIRISIGKICHHGKSGSKGVSKEVQSVKINCIYLEFQGERGEGGSYISRALHVKCKVIVFHGGLPGSLAVPHFSVQGQVFIIISPDHSIQESSLQLPVHSLIVIPLPISRNLQT